MQNLSVVLIYIAFFALIGAAIWMTGSAMPLWALLLEPAITTSKNSDDEGD